MNASTRLLTRIALVLGLLVAPATFAQTLLSEDFTGTTSSADKNGNGNWLFFNGACLTAGSGTITTNPAATIPGCVSVLNSYYKNAANHDQYLMGGANGYLGGTSAPTSPLQQQPDPASTPSNPVGGALRFTNGKPYGQQERGAIVSTNAYSTGAGIQVSFKTVTYGGTGADGMSFYLMDGCVPVAGAILPSSCTPNVIYPSATNYASAIGATGGSLAFTCSNTNGPLSGAGVTFDGLTGAYLGLGIDEYGNFLNQGDNTVSGYGFQPGRIGVRGAGAVSWYALVNAYGTSPPSTSMPYYPASLAQMCGSGSTYDATLGSCETCGSGTYSGNGTGTCTTTTTVTSCPANPVGYNYTYNGTLAVGSQCAECPSGYTYNTAAAGYPNGYCKSGGTKKAPSAFAAATTTTTSSTSSAMLSQSAAQYAVQQTCKTGRLYNFGSLSVTTAFLNPVPPATDAGTWDVPTNHGATSAGAATLANAANTAGILDYPAIPTAYTVLPVANPLYNGSATTRAQATTIFYNLKITSNGLLSLSYSYGGGAYQSVLTNQDIKSTNGTVPPYVRFGFAGSTGGSTNVHEVLCFKSAPAVQSSSSAGVNEKQSAKVETGTFAYFAYYDQNNWVGRVTANALSSDKNTGVVSIATTPAWDASCVLTYIPSGQNCASTGVLGPTPALDPTARVILTYNGGGVPFEWGSLSSAQQSALTTGDSTSAAYRLNYLRGDRSNEVNSTFGCTGGSSVCFRDRTSVLGDIVDSSPTWVGPPQSPYTATWRDKLFPAAAPAENSGTKTYLQYVSDEQSRPNVVYVGSNDGMLHGFRSGEFDNGVFSTTTTPNDGKEVLAYMPGSLLLSPSTGGACGSLAATGSIVQNIHGVTPAYSGDTTPAACVNAALDFSSPQYGHNFFVDATPGTGDLFYGGIWHTWLAGGLGAGGAALFVLDVTDPTSTNFTEGNAANLVVGEWTSGNITCATDAGTNTCNNSLGATYGTPLIRRLHDGRWAVIFGNGYGSTNGDAGIFVMTVDNSGHKLFYYLSTGNTGTSKNNGIAYVTSADLDGDHVTDYLYAGDLMGNLWRFDLTSATESNWAASTAPLFSTPTGQPITTAVTVSAGATPAGGNTIMIAFGTGMRTQFTNAAPVAFQSATQSLYGVWDWNMSGWNAKSATQYAALTPAASGLAAPYTLTQANLLKEKFQLNTDLATDTTTRDIAGTSAICWAGSPGCTTGQFGWYLNMFGAQEQIIYNPQLLQGVLTVNSIVPANNQVTSCTINTDTGFTYAISVLSGGVVPNFFVSFHDTAAAGIETNAVGTSFPVTSSTGSLWLVSQTVTNQPLLTQVNPGANGKGRRLTWVQLR